mmetsp:Transcript_47383/g.102066  ORF Transcript_47383/g.102066 Transcript_47383/m.102066 type:complete len:124 (+) Transcript_47383:10-381(+)
MCQMAAGSLDKREGGVGARGRWQAGRVNRYCGEESDFRGSSKDPSGWRRGAMSTRALGRTARRRWSAVRRWWQAGRKWIREEGELKDYCNSFCQKRSIRPKKETLGDAGYGETIPPREGALLQ